MTTITQDINDLAGVDDNTSWTFYTEQIRLSSSGTAVVSTKKVRKYPVAGVLTVDLDPGPATVIAPDGKKYPFTVPVSASNLWTLIAGAIGMPPGTTQQAIAAAVTDYLNAHPPIMSIADNGDGTMTLTGVSSGSGTVDGGLV